MAAGQGGENLTNVGGIYASVVVSTADTASQLADVRAVLVQLNGVFESVSVGAKAFSGALKRISDAASEGGMSVEKFYSAVGAAISRTTAAELKSDREIQRSKNEAIASAIQGRQNQEMAERSASAASLARQKADALAGIASRASLESQKQGEISKTEAAERSAAAASLAQQKADALAGIAARASLESQKQAEISKTEMAERTAAAASLAQQKKDALEGIAAKASLEVQKQAEIAKTEAAERAASAASLAAQKKDAIEAMAAANSLADQKQAALTAAGAALKKHAEDTDKFYASMSSAVTASNDSVIASQQRLADKQMSLKQVQAAYKQEVLNSRSIMDDRARKDLDYAQALDRLHAAQQGVVYAVMVTGRASRETQIAVEGVAKAEEHARTAADALIASNNAVAASTQRMGQLQNQAGGHQAALADRTMAFTRMTYFAAQGLEDWAYGFRAVVNNIPLVVNELGKLIGMTPQMSMGIAAIASVAGTVIANFESIKGGFQSMLFAGIPITQSATREMKELEKQTEKTAEQQDRYNKLKEEQGRIEEIIKIRSHGEDAQRGAFDKAIQNAGGGKAVRKGLAEVLESTTEIGHDTDLDMEIEKVKKVIANMGGGFEANFIKKKLTENLAGLEENARKKRQENIGVIAEKMLADASTDPQALEGLINRAKAHPGAMGAGLAADLEHARPDQAIKDKIEGFELDPFKAQKKEDAAKKAAAAEATSTLEGIATKLHKGFFESFLKGVDIDSKKIAEAIEAITDKSATAADVETVKAKLKKLGEKDQAEKLGEMVAERGPGGKTPTKEEATTALLQDIKDKEAAEAKRKAAAAELAIKKEIRAEAKAAEPTPEEKKEAREVSKATTEFLHGRTGAGIQVGMRRRKGDGVGDEQADQQIVAKILPGLVKQFGEDRGQKIAEEAVQRQRFIAKARAAGAPIPKGETEAQKKAREKSQAEKQAKTAKYLQEKERAKTRPRTAKEDAEAARQKAIRDRVMGKVGGSDPKARAAADAGIEARRKKNEAAKERAMQMIKNQEAKNAAATEKAKKGLGAAANRGGGLPLASDDSGRPMLEKFDAMLSSLKNIDQHLGTMRMNEEMDRYS